MLYVTTRNKLDTYTAAHALSEDRASDGGFYVPMRLPKLDQRYLKRMEEQSFSDNVADVINLFFRTQLDSWAVEFAIGRYPVKLQHIGSREVVAETWHNPVWKFDRLVRGIEKAVRQSDDVNRIPSDWLMIVSRIAVLVAVFGELIREGNVSEKMPIDLAVANGNFSGAMACWYAREMGLPIGTILCCCNDNNGTWKLLHKGEIRTDAAVVDTDTPLCDVSAPVDLERLISAVLGAKSAESFAKTCAEGGTFYLEPDQQKQLRYGIYVPVVGQRRLESAVRSLYHSCGYLADPYTALCYSGMLDYRSVTGESRTVLIISEESPGYSSHFLAKTLGFRSSELKKQLNQ